MGTFRVLSPIGKGRKTEPLQPVPRVENLASKRLGLFWNGKHNGDILLRRITELLKNKFKDIKVTKFDYGYEGVGHEAIMRMANNSDLVLGAVGD